MEAKINIVEILKDKPQGTKLYSSACGVCIFKEWASDDYTKFNGCYFDGMPNAETAKYKQVDNNTAYGYIRELENRCGGKLNLETLEIEKTQPEFKIGDILFVKYNNRNIIFILSNINGKFYNHRVRLDSNKVIINYSDSHFQNEGIEFIRYATEEEKKQLFSALEKKGKAWDAKKKMLVDLKPKIEFKPFDKVLVRNTDTEEWFPGFFEKFDRTWNYPYHIMNRRSMTDFAFKQCIPYEGNEHLLGTTKDVEG